MQTPEKKSSKMMGSADKNSPYSNKIQYNKLTQFIQRINQMELGDKNGELIQSPSSRQSLVPQLPPSEENYVVEMPNGDKHDIPVYKPNMGPKAIDGRVLHRKTGHLTYDPGFTSTASCVSAITFIDGEKGQLLYRGYSIDKLAESCTFLETCFLLLYGDLPDKS